jgi:hypothetical protein
MKTLASIVAAFQVLYHELEYISGEFEEKEANKDFKDLHNLDQATHCRGILQFVGGHHAFYLRRFWSNTQACSRRYRFFGIRGLRMQRGDEDRSREGLL